jgi:anti-sigma regulatory factor (Ser/Thr protein kinase)
MDCNKSQKFEARTECLEDFIGFVEEKLNILSCPQDVMRQIELASEEIFINISSYAYEPGTGTVEICFMCLDHSEKKSVKITFADKGKQFNPLEHKEPDISIPLENRCCGGLGILFVKRIMDSVEYCFKDGVNYLSVIKSW